MNSLRSALLRQVSSLLGDPGLDSIAYLRAKYPNISKTYPRLNLIKLSELIKELERGVRFPAPAKKRIPLSSREQEILTLLDIFPRMSFAEIGRRLLSPITGQAVGDALKRIKRKESLISQESEGHYLDLSYSNLAKLPADTCKLVNLRHLDLSHNNLVSLPAEICDLFNLRFLVLSHNKLIEIPSEVRLLKKLRHLCLDNNALASRPEVIQRMPWLEAVYLNGNKFDPSDL